MYSIIAPLLFNISSTKGINRNHVFHFELWLHLKSIQHVILSLCECPSSLLRDALPAVSPPKDIWSTTQGLTCLLQRLSESQGHHQELGMLVAFMSLIVSSTSADQSSLCIPFFPTWQITHFISKYVIFAAWLYR